jgi:NTE family protein
MTAPKIGLALGSGSARGWAHIGIIEALADMDIVPDIVCGASMGALVGAAYVTGRLDGLRALIESLDWRQIVSFLDVRMTSGGLIEGSRIAAGLRDLGISASIESCSKPFAAVATDLATGREVWLRSGPIHDAVRASIGIPGVFSPTMRDGAWLVDGGLVNPVPVSLCRALGADIIIAVDLNGDVLGRRLGDVEPATTSATQRREFVAGVIGQLPPALRGPLGPFAAKLLQPEPATPGYFEVLANSLNIMQDHITRTRLAGEPPHVLLRPKLADMRWMDFHRGREAIAEGRACVENAKSALEKYCASED